MSTYQTKKCPHCGKVYERNSYAGRPSKDNRTKYGSPLIVCSSCRKGFLDDEYREIAIDGPREVDTKRISPAGIVYGLLGVIIGLVGFSGGSVVAGCIFLIMGLYFPLSELSSYEKRQEALKKEALASEMRLQNPTYAATLKRLGYDVPEKYLRSFSQDVTKL